MRAVDWVDNLSKGGFRETLACVCLLFRHLLALFNVLSKVSVFSRSSSTTFTSSLQATATSLTYSDRVLKFHSLSS